MAETELEFAIDEFLALGRRVQGLRPLTGEAALREVTAWYGEMRIAGAQPDQDGDMLLFQWGKTSPLEFDEPTDLRELGDNDVGFAAGDQRYLDFTRQVFVTGGAEDADFDESAVQLSVSLLYGPAAGDEASANQWVHAPEELDAGLAELRAVTFVANLLSRPAERAVVTVGYCG